MWKIVVHLGCIIPISLIGLLFVYPEVGEGWGKEGEGRYFSPLQVSLYQETWKSGVKSK